MKQCFVRQNLVMSSADEAPVYGYVEIPTFSGDAYKVVRFRVDEPENQVVVAECTTREAAQAARRLLYR